MHVTFLKTVEPPDAITTFRKGRTFSMPEAMAKDFIDRKLAEPADLPDAEAAEAVRPLDETADEDLE
ncbi:MAG: hypothetical protein ACPGVG_05675 [Mycobacterium sp.]